MSSSAISAAKRRTEAALKTYKIPTSAERTDAHDTSNQVLLSLLQSRLNWSTNVFVKYRSDPEQQPKRNNTMRRRFPMMRELGQATLELGPHLFHDTTFYEAVRVDSWMALGKAAGVEGLDAYISKNEPAPEQPSNHNRNDQGIVNDPTTNNNSNSDSSTDTHMDGLQQQQDTSTLTTTTTTETTETIVAATPAVDSTKQQDSTSEQHSLVYRDIVFELKDQPNERYIFPKDVIMQVLEDNTVAKCSFMLPMDPTCADHFFWDAKRKIQHFGAHSSIPEIQHHATQTSITPTKPASSQSTTIRILHACPTILDTMRSILHPPDQVRAAMIKQMTKVPDRHYLDYSISATEQAAILDLVQRVTTQPDITSGPIAAEKKRNEIGLAIKLGKRPETDQHEAEPPKTKQFIPGREDTQRKCLYCSTRHTVMWRRGPLGDGTLCNGCGILWRQGKILIDAPLINKKVEWQRNKDKWQITRRKWEREQWEEQRRHTKEVEAAKIKEEQEAQHRMDLCLRSKKRRVEPPVYYPPPPTQPQPSAQPEGGSIGLVAAQIAHQQHQQEQSRDSSSALTQALSTVVLPPALPSIAPNPSPPYHIFNLPQIPLPTLCVEFTHLTFSHPHCTVSLSHQKQFTLQLTKDGTSHTFDIPKHCLTGATFEILGQLDSAGRDILLMSCVPTDLGPLAGFGTALYDPADPQRRLTIRFLEKIDALGGPVVKKILECWLAEK
ncbi:hypothetical protein [Absidia glauca]|uniref:GATA-type domain-containing protein n=1 Tax=Absidia glauca TaxID=4829 RepID=A0A168SV15_ABSGL|nr:hypothetical protein [Absidia glauca]